MTENIPPAGNPALEPKPARPRHHLRLAAIGGIAAVAILGGGITAVASASSPGSTTTTTVAPPTSIGSPATGSGTSQAKPPTPKPHLDGTVTSVSGSTVLIKDRDGFTRTILVSSKTTYSDGLKAALPVGTEIHAEGTVDSNGTSLDATSIGKRPTGGPGRGGPGGRGPGGPGDHGGFPGGPRSGQGTGAKPAPPTGTAAPTTSSAAPTTS